MKLAKIDHSRCGEHRATTYVWVADDMGPEELAKLTDEARNNYMAAIDACKNSPDKPPYAGHEPNYRSYPSTVTLAEAQADHDLKKAAYAAWQEQERAAQKTFATYLVDAAAGRIKQFWDAEPALKAGVSWGHRHGDQIDYGEIEAWRKDLNAKVEEDEYL